MNKKYYVSPVAKIADMELEDSLLVNSITETQMPNNNVPDLVISTGTTTSADSRQGVWADEEDEEFY